MYPNREGGRRHAVNLAHRLARLGPNYKNDIPPMTERIEWGISVGPEVSGNQWSVGTSFGMVRCTLIAGALIQSVTGKRVDPGRYKQIKTTVPFKMPKPGQRHSPNRLDFVSAVAENFQRYGISPRAPWR